MEWQTNATRPSRPNSGIGCLNVGVGSQSETGSLWSSTERNLHINVLEMLAGTFAIKTFAKDHSNIHIHLKMYTVAYVNHMGETQSHKLSDAAKDLWTWCLDKGITVSAVNLPGELNTTADFYSRSITGSAEWKLDPYVFKQVARRFGPIQVDLFATRINTLYFLETQPFRNGSGCIDDSLEKISKATPSLPSASWGGVCRRLPASRQQSFLSPLYGSTSLGNLQYWMH